MPIDSESAVLVYIGLCFIIGGLLTIWATSEPRVQPRGWLDLIRRVLPRRPRVIFDPALNAYRPRTSNYVGRRRA